MEDQTREFLFAASCHQEMGEQDQLRAENIHRLVTHLTFIEACVQGGKMSPKEANKLIKDHYKAFKASQTSIKNEWKAT